MRLKRFILFLLAAPAALAIIGCPGRFLGSDVDAQHATGTSKAAAITQGADWSVSVQPDSMLKIYHKGSAVVNVSSPFWGPNWQWAGPKFTRTPVAGDQYRVVGEVPNLKLQASGQISFPAPNTVEMHYLFTAAADVPAAMGGGLAWSFKLDGPTVDGRLPDPELLADHTGWTWKTGPDQAITLRFEKPPAKVYSEQGQKNNIRTFFFADGVPAGSHRFHVTLQLPEGASHVLAADERYETADTSRWFKNALNWANSPVDLSFLNRDDRPAGRHGFVKAEGDHFVFADGTPVRFWGANLAAGALFSTPRETVVKQARRMAQLGYNLMRIHHHDSAWVKPNIFDPKFNDSRHLNAQSLESLDWWIKCMKDQGIYVWIDLHVGRTVMPGDPVSLGREEITRAHGDPKGFCYYNKDLQNLMIEFQHHYLNHTNKYTELRYKDDPAVMCVLITNEDDVTAHQGFAVLPDKNNPAHNALFTPVYKAFARSTGLAESSVFQIWLPGPGKLYSSEIEHRFNQAMIQDLRELGVKAPIATTSYWGGESLFSVPSLTDGDVIDVHSYGVSEALSTNRATIPTTYHGSRRRRFMASR